MNAVQKIRKHLSDNKVTYIACGATAVVVAGVTYYVTKNGVVAREIAASSVEYVGDTVIHNEATIKGVVNWKPTINNIYNLIERSCLSKAVGRLSEDGKTIEAAWASINETARNTNWSAAAISKCANGLTDNLGGEKYVFLKDVIDIAE